MARLTDEELTALSERAHANRAAFGLTCSRIDDAVAEIRERRASDLTEEEREALREFRESFGGSNYPATWKAAIAALGRILGGKP